ncbi:MAG: hypothetical protein AABX88_02020 [Nanoarchaeota archaeon]
MVERIINCKDECLDNSKKKFLEEMMGYVCSNVDLGPSLRNLIINRPGEEKVGYIKIYIQNCQSKNGVMEGLIQKESEEFLMSRGFEVKKTRPSRLLISNENLENYSVDFIKYELGEEYSYLIDIEKAQEEHKL